MTAFDTVKIGDLDDAGALSGHDLVSLRRPTVGVFRAKLKQLAAHVQALLGGVASGLATLGASAKLFDAQVPSIERMPEWLAYLDYWPEAPLPAPGTVLHLDQYGLYADYTPFIIVTDHGAGFQVAFSPEDWPATYVHASAGDLLMSLGPSSTRIGVTTTVVEGTDGEVPINLAPGFDCVAINRSGTQIGDFVGAGFVIVKLSGKGKRCTIERVSPTLFVVNGDVELP